MSVIIIISPPKKPTDSKVYSFGKVSSEMLSNIFNKVQQKFSPALVIQDDVAKK